MGTRCIFVVPGDPGFTTADLQEAPAAQLHVASPAVMGWDEGGFENRPRKPGGLGTSRADDDSPETSGLCLDGNVAHVSIRGSRISTGLAARSYLYVLRNGPPRHRLDPHVLGTNDVQSCQRRSAGRF